MLVTKPKSKDAIRSGFCQRLPIPPAISSSYRLTVLLTSILLLVSLNAVLARYFQESSKISPGRLSTFPEPEPDDPRRQLTIVVDRARGDEQCVAFIHKLLPSWIQWRYLAVHDDNLDILQIKTPVLLVTRWIETSSSFLGWARRHPYPVGLMLMADETNDQNAAVYTSFDYVLRHYYFQQLRSHPHITVRALGNMTCGQGPVFPAVPTPPDEPRHGVHWILLQGRGLGNLDSGHGPGSYWPASQRRRPAMWIGSLRADRSEMVDVMRSEFPDADIQVEGDFGGHIGPFEYGHLRTAGAVFALVPFGNNPETHRLAEVLDQGSIPVFLDAAFQHAPFESVPGIVAASWPDAARQMKDLLQDPVRLDRLQDQVAEWWQKLQSCMRSDLDIIFRAANSIS